MAASRTQVSCWGEGWRAPSRLMELREEKGRNKLSELMEESSGEVATSSRKCILRVPFPCGNGVGQHSTRAPAGWVMGEAEQSVVPVPSCKGFLTPDIWLSIWALVTCNPTSQLLPWSLPPVPLPTSLHCVLAHLPGLTQPRSHTPQSRELRGRRAPSVGHMAGEGPS